MFRAHGRRTGEKIMPFAARVTDMIVSAATLGVPTPILPPGAPTVLIAGLPAARVGDMTLHSSCVAPIPGPTGKILPPGCPTVMIGG